MINVAIIARKNRSAISILLHDVVFIFSILSFFNIGEHVPVQPQLLEQGTYQIKNYL